MPVPTGLGNGTYEADSEHFQLEVLWLHQYHNVVDTETAERRC